MENDSEISMSSHAFSSQQEDFEPFVDTLEQQKDILVMKREQLHLLICGAMLSILKILNIRFPCPKLHPLQFVTDSYFVLRLDGIVEN